jgi:metallo-beta-lactamase class B
VKPVTTTVLIIALSVTATACLQAQSEAGTQEQTPKAQSRSASGPPPSRNLPTQQQWDSNSKVQEYVAKAKEIAGDDPDLKFDVGIFCQASGGATNEDRAKIGVPDSQPKLKPYPAPMQAQPIGGYRLFDNFYWFGDTGVGAWLVTTPAGYILFDTTNSDVEMQDVVIPAMKKFNLDPTKIRYVVFGHFHLDHTGGGHYIEELAHPTLIMGRDDWDLYYKAMKGTGRQLTQIKDKTPMNRGLDAVDGMKITLGGLTATIYEMTGHTPGSIGMVVPVDYQGKEHPILLVTAGTDVHNRDAFIGGYEHIWDAAINDKVESVMQVHPNTNMNLLARTKYVNDNYPPANNPLLYGVERTRRNIEIMRACTQARLEALGW